MTASDANRGGGAILRPFLVPVHPQPWMELRRREGGDGKRKGGGEEAEDRAHLGGDRPGVPRALAGRARRAAPGVLAPGRARLGQVQLHQRRHPVRHAEASQRQRDDLPARGRDAAGVGVRADGLGHRTLRAAGLLRAAPDAAGDSLHPHGAAHPVSRRGQSRKVEVDQAREGLLRLPVVRGAGGIRWHGGDSQPARFGAPGR